MRWTNKIRVTVGPVETMAACIEETRNLGFRPCSVEFDVSEICRCRVVAIAQDKRTVVSLEFEHFGGTPLLLNPEIETLVA